MMQDKTCTKCGRVYPATGEYWGSRNGKYLSQCRQCVHDRQSAWYYANRERILESFREYGRANSDKIKANVVAWQRKNRDKRLITQRRYREKNRMILREKNTQYHRANPLQRSAEKHRRRAREMSAPGSHTAADIAVLWEKSKHRCYWCGKRIRDGKYHIDHVTPLALGGSDGLENLVISCPTCNMKKNARPPQEWGVLF